MASNRVVMMLGWIVPLCVGQPGPLMMVVCTAGLDRFLSGAAMALPNRRFLSMRPGIRRSDSSPMMGMHARFHRFSGHMAVFACAMMAVAGREFFRTAYGFSRMVMAGSWVRVRFPMRGVMSADMPFRGMGMTISVGSPMLDMAARGLFPWGITVARGVG